MYIASSKSTKVGRRIQGKEYVSNPLPRLLPRPEGSYCWWKAAYQMPLNANVPMITGPRSSTAHGHPNVIIWASECDYMGIRMCPPLGSDDAYYIQQIHYIQKKNSRPRLRRSIGIRTCSFSGSDEVCAGQTSERVYFQKVMRIVCWQAWTNTLPKNSSKI